MRLMEMRCKKTDHQYDRVGLVRTIRVASATDLPLPSALDIIDGILRKEGSIIELNISSKLSITNVVQALYNYGIEVTRIVLDREKTCDCAEGKVVTSFRPLTVRD